MKVSACLIFAFLVLLCAPVFAAGELSDARRVGLWTLFEPDGEQAQDEGVKPAPGKFGLPGWWGYEQTRDSYKAAFLPFYYRYEDADVSITHFWPLYGHKSRKGWFDTHYTLWPFFRYTKHEDGATQIDMPWPFVSLYESKERFSLRIFPLLHIDIKEEKEGAIVVFPIFWHVVGEENRGTVFFPFYWDIKTPEQEFWHLWPLSGYWKAPGYRRTMLGFPLFSYTRRWDPQKPIGDQPADRQIDLLWPLIRYRSGPGVKQYGFLPFFWYGRNRYATYFHLWPYSISKTHDGDEKKINIAYPLLYIHTKKSIGLTEVAVPAPPGGLSIFRYRSVKDQYVLCQLFPLFSYVSDKRTRSVRISGPAIVSIFNYTSQPHIARFADHSVKGRSVSCQLFPVFAYHSSPKNFSITVAPLFSYSRKLDAYENSEIQFHSLLFSYAAGPKGYDFRILTGLFGFGRRHDNSYIRLLWLLKL